ncbi:MAG: hypothetical protein CL696_04295 [Chloroflexi bacterium]|nr:hypothetical protein [Chloroflexota bacterium]MDP6498464.1 hypothetical protein [Dehalococcoidia bacterium]MQG11498.1 hypothetical protein [SAR202 cluster bacterium]MQG55606.1 hypothetical protein [SAR202 cluster bacterium]
MPDLGDTTTVQWDSALEAIERCYELGWTDGLPVVPPTERRVEEFIERSGLPSGEVVGELPERRREITVGKVAANAVMAGCLPEYMPVVLAATEAMLEPIFNLVGPSSSMGGAAILSIVNGPVCKELGINSRNNLFGPGNRANATIGRAVRLILMNACAAIPGVFDRSVIGHPGKYTYCIAEADTETHWTPLHVERGFAADQSTVTVFAGESPRQVRAVGHPEPILLALADVASSLGSNMSTSGSVGDTGIGVRQGQIVVTVAGNSNLWKDWTKAQAKEYIFARCQRSVADLKAAMVLGDDPEPGDAENMIPLIPEPDDILLIFAGGEESNMSSVIPSWGPKVGSTAVTKLVR